MDEKRFLTGENWKRIPTAGGLFTDTGGWNEQLFLKYPSLRQANTEHDGPESEIFMGLDYAALGELIRNNAHDPEKMKLIEKLVRQKLAGQQAERAVSLKNMIPPVKSDFGPVPDNMVERLDYRDPFGDSTK